MSDLAGAYDIKLHIVNQTQYALKLVDSYIYTSGGWGRSSSWRANTSAGLIIPAHETGPTHTGHTDGAVDTQGELVFTIQGMSTPDVKVSFQFAVQDFPFGKGWVFLAGTELPHDLKSLFYVTGTGNAKSYPVTGQWTFSEYVAP